MTGTANVRSGLGLSPWGASGRAAAAVTLIAIALAARAGVPSVAAGAARAPAVRAPAAILVEPATGDVVFARNVKQRRPIASATKLMTALVVLEHASLDDVMTAVPYAALPAESIVGLRAGERLTVRDLLRALLLASANDAAATLAVRVAGSRAAFVAMMNRRARSLRLVQTRFANPIGLDDPRNHSSATDLAKLTLVLRQRPFFRATTDSPRAVLRSGARHRVVVNRNRLVRSTPFVNGVKTGHTRAAGYVLVGSASRAGVTVVSAVLGDPTEAAREADTLALLRYGLSRYHVATALRRGRVLATARLALRDGTVELVAGATVRRTAKRGERFALRVVGAPTELEGPLPRGARVGTVIVRQRGRAVARIPLVTRSDVAAVTFMERLGEYLGRATTLMLLAAFTLCSLYLVLLRRRALRGRGARGATVT